MAVQRPEGFAVSVVREDGRWRCARMDEAALGELDAAITELRQIRSTGAVFGMLAVDDEFRLKDARENMGSVKIRRAKER